MDRKFLIKEDRQKESISEMSGDDYHKAHFKWWVHMDEYRLHNYESIGCSDLVKKVGVSFLCPKLCHASIETGKIIQSAMTC